MEIVRADREIAEHVEGACATGDIQIVHEAVFEAVDMYVPVLRRREALVRRYFPSLSRYHLSLEPRGISLVSPDGDVKAVWNQEEDEEFGDRPHTCPDD
ncbi:hypothetical protein [Mycobacterium sp. URHB0021]